MDAKATVKQFVVQKFLRKNGSTSISSEESLLDTGLIDSLGIFQLVTFLEQQFNIEVTDEDIVPENFETIDSIVSFINTKRV